MNDELISQNIEISALTQRNAALQADNAGLLQRWLDKMNLTADRMNVEFEKEAAVKGKKKEGREDEEGAKEKEKDKEKGKETEGEGDFRRGGKA